ncbi:hypothetical protein D9M71_122590 [compost metagenome]
MAFGLRLGEWREQPLLIGAVDADAAVLDPQVEHGLARLFARLKLQVQADLAAFGKLDCVTDQVRQYLLESQRVDQYLPIGLGIQGQEQAELFLPRQAVEYPHH